MTRQMHLILIKETGHVLGAVAQAASAGDPAVEALVGKDLAVMMPQDTGGTLAFATLVPAELLEVKSATYDPAVVANPQSFVMDGGRIVSIPTSAALLNPANLTDATIELQKVIPDVPIVVVLASKADGNAERRAQSGKFGIDPTLFLTHAILPGETPAAITQGADYLVLIAYAGRRLEWQSLTA